ncbi:MAG TPA: YaaA family protein [Micromonosporaceae bacterium]|nr:YaaA family protein [Micromonosporaceae bacterium]
MIILMHSSKTMRPPTSAVAPRGVPVLLDRAEELVAFLRTLPPQKLARTMSLSADLAARTRQQYAEWSTEPGRQTPAAATFVGDIYSGLRVDSFTAADRAYADTHLRILSGLYGILRPFDGISPYRLEMGYRLPPGRYANLYRFWGAAIAETLPASGRVVNLAANEYSKAVLPHLDADRVVTPRFLTADPASGKPKFVVVHAKIARGAFARWLVTGRVAGTDEAIRGFRDIGYRYDESVSTAREPTFVCAEFGGKGLSVRLT